MEKNMSNRKYKTISIRSDRAVVLEKAAEKIYSETGVTVKWTDIVNYWIDHDLDSTVTQLIHVKFEESRQQVNKSLDILTNSLQFLRSLPPSVLEPTALEKILDLKEKK